MKECEVSEKSNLSIQILKETIILEVFFKLIIYIQFYQQ